MLCADEQVRHAIERVFELWRRVGSARQVVDGADRRGSAAAPPHGRAAARSAGRARAMARCTSFLTNPAYAGAFVFGRNRQEKHVDARRAACTSGTSRCRSRSGPSACPSTIPAMSAGSEYLATRERLRANVRPRGEGGGAAREGGALLQGLVRCGRCGRRMQVAYSGNDGKVRRYRVRAAVTCCTPPTRPARSLGGGRLEKAVADGVPRSGHPGRGRGDRRRDPRARGPARAAARRPAPRAGARRVRGRARASASSTRASRRTGSSHARWSASSKTRSAAVERERGKLAALEHARPAAAHRRGARSARRPRA